MFPTLDGSDLTMKINGSTHAKHNSLVAENALSAKISNRANAING